MRELGRRGGRTPKMTALRRAAAEQDDTLREAARAVLARALAGEQVDKEQLAAARSLFSYRADSPPVGAQAREQTGGKVIGLADVVRVAVECGLVRAGDGGPVLVDGERVERNDPRTPSPTKSRDQSTPNERTTLQRGPAPEGAGPRVPLGGSYSGSHSLRG
jgi:plasmid stability protein